MHPRFSLRTLLIVTALVAAACWWWIARPTIVAQRFVAAVDNDDYVTLQSLWIDRGDPSYLDRYTRGRQTNQLQRATYKFLPRTWHDLRHRQRRMGLRIGESYYCFHSNSGPLILTVSNAGVRGPEVFSWNIAISR